MGRSRQGLSPARPRVMDVRELRTMIEVRSVARRVLTRAERDLADRPETLNCGLLVLHVHRLPEMVNTWLCASGRPTMVGPLVSATPFVCRNSHPCSDRFGIRTFARDITPRSGH